MSVRKRVGLIASLVSAALFAALFSISRSDHQRAAGQRLHGRARPGHIDRRQHRRHFGDLRDLHRGQVAEDPGANESRARPRAAGRRPRQGRGQKPRGPGRVHHEECDTRSRGHGQRRRGPSGDRGVPAAGAGRRPGRILGPPVGRSCGTHPGRGRRMDSYSTAAVRGARRGEPFAGRRAESGGRRGPGRRPGARASADGAAGRDALLPVPLEPCRPPPSHRPQRGRGRRLRARTRPCNQPEGTGVPRVAPGRVRAPS